MKEFIVEFYYKSAPSVLTSARIGSRSANEARMMIQREKGNDIIIRSTYEA